MRFNSVITLRDVSVTIDENGGAVSTFTDSVVFANLYTIGASTWVAARAAGLHADAEVALRSADYGNQQRVVIDEIEYEVERVSNEGEFTRLMLERRLRNA